jgi:AcrR family transcriptional regulator
LVKGNLYYYFKNKQDILYHCHVKCIAISLAALDDVSAMGLAPADALRILLIKHIRNITEDPYGGVLLTDLESLTPTQRRRYVAMRDRFEHGVREMISGGIADGVFAPQNIDLAGITILGAINWIPKWYRTDGRMSSAEIANSIADQLIRSLRP